MPTLTAEELAALPQGEVRLLDSEFAARGEA